MKKLLPFRKALAILLAALTVMSSLVILPITASATESIRLDISTENQKLRVRLKLSDPFGFMAITSLSMDGQTVAIDDYAAHGVTEVGFQFLKSKAKKDTAAILADANTVKATARNTTRKISMPYMKSCTPPSFIIPSILSLTLSWTVKPIPVMPVP